MLEGITEPRISTKPLRELTPETSHGFDAIEFAEDVLGMTLIPWQKEFLIRCLEINEDGTLRFRTVILCVARQNGKSTVMIVLAMFFMHVLEEGELVLGTAQNLETSEGTWEDAVTLAESVPTLASDIPKSRGVNRVNGNKYLRFTNRSMWKVATATRKGGRGKAAKLVLMDELREHQNFEAWAAIANTTLAQEGALVLGVSNAGDAKSVVLKKQREKAIEKLKDRDTTMAIFEWSAPDDADPDDENAWMQANPSCNHYPSNLTLDNLRAARESATDNDWKIENLCQWITVDAQGPWHEGTWENLANAGSKISENSPVVLAVDTSYDRSMCYIAVAGRNNILNKVHVEIIAAREGTEWVAGWIDRRFDAIGPTHVAIQGPTGAPASPLIEVLEDKGIPVTPVQGSNVTGAAVKFYDAVSQGNIVHIDQPVLNMVANTARKRNAGDGLFMWDRKNSPVDCAPLIAIAEAWLFLTNPPVQKNVSAFEREEARLVVL